MKKSLLSLFIIVAITLLAGGPMWVSAQQAPPAPVSGQMNIAPPPLYNPPGLTLAPPASMPPGAPVAAPGAPAQTEGPPPAAAPPLPPAGALGARLALGNALKAVTTARDAKKYLAPGKVWIDRGPAGEVTMKAAIVYQGVAVGALEFDPVSGAVLPRGYHPRVFSVAMPTDTIKQRLPNIIAKLRVLDAAEYRDPEHSWVIPLAYNAEVVAHIKVYQDGIHIVPDYPVTQEMQAYGR